MCGIAGIISDNRDTVRRALPAMIAAQVHRGPDDSGAEYLEAGPLALGMGFRRLSILDLSPAGHQPMHHPTNGDVITFNGEIYNFRVLRGELEAEGVTFRGHSDTEVLLHGLARHGAGIISRLEGMYAFAWYCKARNELLLCRDPLGIKPLYFAALPQGFLYGSELRVLTATGLVPKRLDRGALYGMLAYGSVQEPRTIFDSVQALPAGCYQVLDLSKPLSQMTRPVQRYWNFPTIRQDITEVQAGEAVRHTLESAVRDHLVSDVPVGVFLSSGLDSTIVAALAARHTPQLRTFTVAFADEPDMSEGQYAAETAARIGAQHTEIQITGAEALATASRWLESLDQPSSDGLNTYVISQAVRERGIVVALSGLGGDELFGGYNSFRLVPRMTRLRTALGWLPAGARRAAAGLAAVGQPLAVRQKAADMLGSHGDVLSLYTYARRAQSDSALSMLGAAPASANLDDCFLPPRALADWSQSNGDIVSAVSQLEARLYMGNTLLRDSDTNGMAHSLEIRVPMLDRRLLDLAFSIPGRVRLPQGVANKHLLRSAFSDLLPPQITALSKRGFTLPVGRWIVGPLRDLCESGIKHLKTCDALRPEGVEAAWQAYLAEPHGRRWAGVLSLCVIGLYCKRMGL